MKTAYVPRSLGGPDLRGNATDRRRRREWLVNTYRADQDAIEVHDTLDGQPFTYLRGVWRGDGQAACRCYRCGVLLTVDTVTADRIIPGCRGGRYVRGNLRPACSGCNSETGGALRAPERTT